MSDVCWVAFIGHRRIRKTDDLLKRLEKIVYDCLCKYEYTEFYVGVDHDFDSLAATAVKTVQEYFPKERGSLVLILPYHMPEEKYYRRFYDDIRVPIDRTTHRKSAIINRDEWLINHCELFVCYVGSEKEEDNAYNAMKYAESKGVRILNLADSVKG